MGGWVGGWVGVRQVGGWVRGSRNGWVSGQWVCGWDKGPFQIFPQVKQILSSQEAKHLSESPNREYGVADLMMMVVPSGV